MRLLLVEDNQSLVASIFEYFEGRGHTLDAAPDGLTGLHLAMAQEFDAIVLDWMLPRVDGPTLVRRLRIDAGNKTPIIMLTARGELPDKLEGFRAGADDYLTKPFELAELEARLQALVARGSGSCRQDNVLVLDDLRLNLSTLETTRGTQTIRLYPACRKLLEVLMRASPSVVPRQRLEAVLWSDSLPDADLLRSHMYELRRAIDAPFPVKLLHTVQRVGYRLAIDGAA
jgi:DNA-binding response OmpR family regulator